MKASDRRQAIMDVLLDQGTARVTDLASRFGVSKMTIHRDLDELEAGGLLRKIRGGASIKPSSQFESDYRYRQAMAGDEKDRIARVAAERIEPGQAVIIDDGSTAAGLAPYLVDCRPITVITNNLTVINSLADAEGINLIALGGNYSKKFNGFFGLGCEEALRSLRADVAFLSSSAIQGTSAFHQNQEVVQAKRAMISSAERCHLLVDHTKFGRQALHFLTELTTFDSIITGAELDRDHTEPLRECGVELVVADEAPGADIVELRS